MPTKYPIRFSKSAKCRAQAQSMLAKKTAKSTYDPAMGTETKPITFNDEK
jgi:hypothetical protein